MNPSERLEAVCRETMEAYGMISRGDRLVVGVSGGADSVALLCVLRALSQGLGFTLAAAHLNHKLRGAESDRDEAHVRDLCRTWDIPLTAASRPIAALAKSTGRSVEECARDERYALLRHAAGQGGKIATAHTLDDSAETVLLNLVRGTGTRGLCGIPPVRDGIIRPLIRSTRRDVEAYCAANGLAYVTDSTNLSADYTRNKLRLQVMPVLREINPALLRHIEQATDALRADADYLAGLAGKALAHSRLGEGCWDREKLLALAEPVLRRCLLQLCALHGIPAQREKILRMHALLQNGGKEQLSGDWYCLCARGVLCFETARAQEQEEFASFALADLSQRREYRVFSDKTLLICPWETGICEKNKNIAQNQFKNAVDCDKIEGLVECRPRRVGDAIRLAGRGCTKSLRKIYQEAGLSSRQRRRCLVLADEAGPVWVEGFGVAERVCPSPDSCRVLTLHVTESG